jgi:uncharacterized membrane protein
MDVWSALVTVLISAAPVFELRAGLPLALGVFDLPPSTAFLLSVTGNLLVVPPLLWGLAWAERLFMRWRWSGRFMQWVFARTRSKGRWVERLGSLGLLLIVAIPLPGTGAWTGSILARLLGIPHRRALLWISLGVLLAGVLVLAASMGVIQWVGVPAQS